MGTGTGEQSPNLKRRKTDYGWRKWIRVIVRENWYRDLWLIVITGFAVLAVYVNGNTLDQVQQSRVQSTGIICGVLSAITDAGRIVITSSATAPETPLTKFLEQHGYPPREVRSVEARKLSKKYAESISNEIATVVGHKNAVHLVNANGTINCKNFQKLVVLKS